MMNEREKIIHLWFRNEGCTGGRRYGMAKVIKENLDGFYMEIDIFSFAAYNNSDESKYSKKRSALPISGS